ncbi:hypothetical protein STENM223S_01609 [Streptomyces tendae]
MAVRPAGFACLPDDPAAALPGARVVADEEALRAEVRAAAAEHLEPVLAGFGPRMRRRGRALWGMATDEIVEGLWYVAHLLGEQERATARAGAAAAGRDQAVRRRGDVPRADRARTATPLHTRDRASCCMFYTLRPDGHLRHLPAHLREGADREKGGRTSCCAGRRRGCRPASAPVAQIASSPRSATAR